MRYILSLKVLLINPNHDGVVYPVSEGIHQFNSTDFVTTTLGIYRIHLEEGVSYISSNMTKLYDEVLFKLENLATGGVLLCQV